MKRNALLTLVCCLVMGVAALVAAPRTALAIPYHAADSELQGTAYAVLNPTTGELDFVRSTETHADKSTGTVKSISGGTYTGTIYSGFENLTGSSPSWRSTNSQVKSVRFVDAVRPRSVWYWFHGMRSCTTMDLSKLDTSQVTGMYQLFHNCSSLTSLDLSSFDTSKVTDMGQMFDSCESLTSLDLSHFDTSQVMGMAWMFKDCYDLTTLDVSSFDTSKVTNMTNMFDGCTSLNKITFGDKFTVN